MGEIKTLGALRASGYRSKTVKEEIRHNLRRQLASDQVLFPGILGYDRTVVPGVVNALLAKHDFILLGLRGQAKSRLLRSLVDLLDEEIPVLAGTELNGHVFFPITPCPESLVVRYTREGVSRLIDVPLVGLANLHVSKKQQSPGVCGNAALSAHHTLETPYQQNEQTALK